MVRVLNKPSAIFNLISKCCDAKLEVIMVYNKQTFPSYFISYESDRFFILINKFPDKSTIKPGQKLTIKFSMVYGGILHDFRIEGKVIKNEDHQNFPSLFIEYPQKIFEEGEDPEYRVALPEVKPVILNAYINGELYPQNILKIGIQNIQFQFNAEGKSKKM